MIIINIMKDVIPSIWPLVAFISMIAITLRCTYLYKNHKKFIFHKELMSLIFIIYILCMYYILIRQNVTSGGINLIPFKEMFRYSIGSYKFMKNIVGNIILFIPFGFFASYYCNIKSVKSNLLTTLIVSLCVETMQYYIGRIFDIDDIILNILGGFLGYLLFICLIAIKEKLPKFMTKDSFINFIAIILIIIIVLFSLGINIFSYV